MEVQFHNENVHIMLHRISHFFIAIVDDNLLNEKRRVNEMARHITCTLSHCQWVGSQWQGNMSHTHKQQAAPIWSSSNQCVVQERIFFLSSIERRGGSTRLQNGHCSSLAGLKGWGEGWRK